MKQIETPQTDIDLFLDNTFNILIYESLTNGWTAQSDLFEPLAFFNLLYSELEFFKNNSENYITIKNHFQDYNSIFKSGLSKEQTIFLLQKLIELIKETVLKNNENEVVEFSYYFLLDIAISFDEELDFGNSSENDNDFYFENTKKELKKITSTPDKIKYLVDCKTDYLQNNIVELDNVWNVTFDKKCDLEIIKLKELLALETTPTTQTPPTVPAPENTLNWQGTELQFTELFKAVYEAKMLDPKLNQTEIFKRLKLFFQIKDFKESDKIREVTDRNEPTPFLNILETALVNFRNKKLENRKK